MGIFSYEIVTRYYFHSKRSFIFIDSYTHTSLIDRVSYQLSDILPAPAEESGPGLLALQLHYTVASEQSRKPFDCLSKY